MKKYIALLGLLLLSACGGSDSTDGKLAERVLVADSGCDAAQLPCRAAGDNDAMTLRLGPEVKPLQRFGIEVDIDSDEAIDTVVVEFDMAGMDMGQNRYRLVPSGDGHWRGEAILPICSTGSLEWLATVSARSESRQLVTEFPFITRP